MSYIKNIFSLVICLFIFNSCDDYLDIKPYGRIIPQKTSDYDLLLNKDIDNSASAGFVSTYNNDLFMSDDFKITSFSQGYYSPEQINAYKFADHIYLDNNGDTDWDKLYSQIYTCNVVISEVMDSEGGTPIEKLTLQNEARVQKANAYLALVNLYAKHYDPKTASTDLGVPIRSRIDFEEDLTRQSVQKVYDLIIGELSTATQQLNQGPTLGVNFRANLAAAYGLLARTYLYMNNIDEALNYANLALGIKSTLINFNSLPTLFFDPYKDKVRGLDNVEVLLYRTQNVATSIYYLSDDLAMLYTDPNDLRFVSSSIPDFVFGQNSGYISTEYFSGRYANKGVTTAEMYLIKAECHARRNETTQALDAVNTLRSYRFKTGTNYKLTATNSSEALQLIKEDRRKELAFAGQRLFDIKRYNAFDNAGISISHQLPSGENFTIEAGNSHFILPIGRKYIALNPEIEQNPR